MHPVVDLTVRLEWFLAVVYLIVGCNDLFLDLLFYFKPLRDLVAQGRENPRCEEWELDQHAEQSVAILIPAWDESTVIGAMLESTSDRLDYQNYDIFVGTYPNDEATQFEVARAAFNRPRIHRVVCPNPGPTSKADCLNWVVEAVKLKEIESGKRYEIFVLQDAEDVVHPLSLKVFNRFVPEYDLVQLPVIPYERPLHNITGNTYLDEFAENHLKTLTSRLAIGGMVPSAGVGTAFSRAACDELAAQTNHVLFPPVSLTEDYDFSFRLFRNHRRSGLAEVWVDRTDSSGRHVKELVAIREFFPRTFGDAVRQKQRWLLGITFQGAQKLGWGSGLRERYMLLRDRIGVATAVFNLIALFIFFRLGELILEALIHHQPWQSALPPYQPDSTLSIIIDINLVLLLNRLIQRAVFVAKVGRKRQAFMAPFRLLWSNVVDFFCVYHAVRRFMLSEISGKPLKWMKTTHEYPSVETLLNRHRPLGDLLLERRLISPDQLREGLELQARPAFRDRYLGEILVETFPLTQDQLLEALALQTNARVSLRQPVTAKAIPLTINQIVPQPETPAGAQTAATTFPSQLEPAPVPGRPVMPIFVPVGLMTDPVARASRSVPGRTTLRSYEFAGAAPRPRQATGVRHIRPRTPTPANAQEPEAFRTSLVRSVVSPPFDKLTAQPEAIPSGRRFNMLHTISSNWKPSNHKRFVVVIGTRPEAIKLAPVVLELRKRAAEAGRPDDVFVCTTGQHRDMVHEPLALFGIKPDLDLEIMEHGQSLATISARVLESVSHVLAELRPEWVLVQGDTATTAMAAMAAFYAGIQVAHIEAGLRTNDMQNPFPEEANRRLVGMFATMHFAATEFSRKNLLLEGVPVESIKVTGNTGIDALHLHCERLGLGFADRLSGASKVSESAPIRILVTAHRRENLASGIFDLCQSIRSIVEEQPDRFHFVWPLHPNPRVTEVARRYLSGLSDVTLCEPVPYDRLLGFLAQCDIVLTDSGGLQEEAPSFGKPVLILRSATERPEGVWAGLATLVGTDPTEIRSAIEDRALQIRAERHRLLTSDLRLATPANPYGDGHAACRIADYFMGIPGKEFAFESLRHSTQLAPHSSGQRQAMSLQSIQ